MRVVWRQGKESMSVLRSGRREPDRCCQGRMRRYPDCFASGPGLSQQGVRRLRQRIDRSIVFQSYAKIDEWRHEDSRKRECHQHPFANGQPSCCPHPLRRRMLGNDQVPYMQADRHELLQNRQRLSLLISCLRALDRVRWHHV
jgi:hypothetical protein